MGKRDLRAEVLLRIGGNQLVDYLRSQGHDVQRSGSEWKMLCPFHDDHRPSLCVNERKRETGLFKCFSCGWGGDVFDFVGEMHRFPDFVDQLKFIASQLGIADGPRPAATGKAAAPRAVTPAAPAIPVMEAKEVLAAYREYKRTAMEPESWCEELGIDPRALVMLGAVVAPVYDRVALVVPMRRNTGVLCSLRFRCFETKKRWSLDQKQRIAGELRQVKTTRAGLMATPEFFDVEVCRDYLKTVVVEGETDLLAGLTMMLRSYGDDTIEWPARWIALPGVGTCHDLLMDCIAESSGECPVVLLFLDDDEAGRNAAFSHRRYRYVEDEHGKRQHVKDLDEPRQPGLLNKLQARGWLARVAFPPDVGDGKKHDLRDMVRDGWGWQHFYEHCLDHATADPHGLRQSKGDNPCSA